MKKFNDDFIFSASTCAFQVEGGRHVGGRKDSIWDKFTRENFYVPKPNETKREINSIEVASNFYKFFEKDAKIMKKIGMNALVYNMDWARIFPNNSTDINEEGLSWYENMFKALKQNGIKPIPILYHWDTPLWLEERGGASSKNFLPAFKNFAKVVFERLGKYTDMWYVNDENSTFTTSAYLSDYLPPQKNDKKEFWKSIHVLTLSGAIAKKEFIKAKEKGFLQVNAMLGIDHDWNPGIPYDYSSQDDIDATNKFNEYNLNLFLDPNILGKYPNIFFEEISNIKLNEFVKKDELELIEKYKLDFIGWNYYRPAFIMSSKNSEKNNEWQKPADKFIIEDALIVYPKTEKYTSWNWLIKPDKLVDGARHLWNRYKKPLMIVENGIGYFDEKKDGIVDDTYRIDFLNNHLKEVQRATSEGIPFIGYSLWTYNDVFSPSGGYRKKYGLVGVDFEGGTLERFPKSSMMWYKDVIESKSAVQEKINYDKYKTMALNERGKL